MGECSTILFINLLKIVSLFCERLILKLYSPPLARACSSCPIHNSQFPPRLTCPICPTFRLTIIMCPQHKRTFRITSFKIHQYLFTYFRDKEESYLKCLLFYHLNKVIPIYKWYPYLFLSIYPLFCYLYRYLLCKY